MGVLDSVRSLFGRDGSAGSSEEATGNASYADGNSGRTADETGGNGDEGGDGPPPGFERTGPELQVHGSHWDTVLPEEHRSFGSKHLTMEAVSEGDVLEGEPVDGASVTGHRYLDGPLGTMAVSVGGEIATTYPIAVGIEHDVDTTGLKQWENGLEAWVRCTLGDAAVTALVTSFFEHPAEFCGGECRASLAVCMYDFGIAETDTVVDADGAARDGSDFVGFRPYEHGASDDYVVRTVVDDVEPVSHDGYDAYRIDAPLYRRSNGRTVDAAFYVGPHLLDREPQVSESVEGAGWLQARFHRGGG
jgi:hypothetical protein